MVVTEVGKQFVNKKSAGWKGEDMIGSGTCGGVRVDKINPPKPQPEEEMFINGDSAEYRDLVDKENIQVGDIFYNPDWEVGGPWYLVKEGNSAIGKQYVPGKMKRVRRRISE